MIEPSPRSLRLRVVFDGAKSPGFAPGAGTVARSTTFAHREAAATAANTI